MDLTELIRLAKSKGLMGVVVLTHSGRDFLACGYEEGGTLSDVRNWDYHPTAEAALENLKGLIERMETK